MSFLRGQESKYSFHYLSTGDGLSNSCVQCIHEDHRGCIWIGTESGANLFDGYVVRQASTTNANGLKIQDQVYSIQEDYIGNIWVNYTDGYYVYTDLTSFVDAKTHLSTFGVPLSDDGHVHIDRDGNIWSLDTDRVYFYDLKTGKSESFKSALNYEFQQEVEVQDYKGVLYIIDDEKLWKFDSKGLGWKELNLPEELAQTNDRYSIFIDDEGSMWVYSLQRELVFRRRGADKTGWEKAFFPQESDSYSNQVRFVSKDSDGNIWIATDHRGVFIYDKNLQFLKNIRHERNRSETLATDNVAYIMCDHRGAMWLGHYKKGLSYTHPSFSLLDNHSGEFEDVSTILSASDGTLWIGSDGFGLYSKKNDVLKKEPLPNMIMSGLMEDLDKSVWVGSNGKGLFNIKGGAIKQYTAESGALLHNNIWFITQDKGGRIWYLSGWNPLAIFDPRTGKSEVYKTSEGEDVTGASLYYDKVESKLYVGTYWGLCVIDDTGVETIYHGNSSGAQEFVDQTIAAVSVDHANNMVWLGHKDGLTVWDKKQDFLYKLTKDAGLCDNNIKSIVVDKQGIAWVSTSNGLMSITPKRENSGSIAFTIKSFTTTEGLVANYFNQTGTITSDGHILFGNAAGYVEVDPTNVVPNSETNLVPEVLDCRVSGKVVPLSSLRRLNYDDYLISIRFFTKEILDANDVQFAYKMEGLNDAWIYTRNPLISFMSMPPGDYQLTVKACGIDGVWGIPSVIPIHVDAPFYLTWWMKAIYCLIGLLIIAAIILYVIHRQKEKVLAMEEQFEQEQAVKLSEMKLQFFTNLSHDLRTPLTLIMAPVESLLNENLPESVLSKLNIVKKNANQLYQQVGSLLDFRRLDVGGETLRPQQQDLVVFIEDVCSKFSDYSIERKIKFNFDHEESRLIMQFDPEKMGKVMYNLLSNAFKFTQDKGTIGVSLKVENGNALIAVSDTGRGIPEEDKENIFNKFYQADNASGTTGSGIGLSIVEGYVKLHGGKIAVKDNKPRGSVFYFNIPIVVNETVAEDGDMEPESMDSVKSKNRSFTLLVVDDNADMLEFVNESLKDEYNVVCACDGKDAIEKLTERDDIDLVLSDVMMPKLNGLELCERIKNDINISHIPVILLTAKVSEQARMEGLEAGADDYITKPFNIEHLRLRIRKFIELSAQRTKDFEQKIEVSPAEMTFSSLDEILLKKALDVVESHISDAEFNVEALGREVGLSRGHLYKKLMSITGHGPQDFIRTIRLKKGKYLLEQGQYSVSEVASMVGYNSLKTFTENFKTVYGMTPTDYLHVIKK